MTEHELQKLLNSLSLEEKAFQLSQVPGPFYVKDAQIAVQRAKPSARPLYC